MRGVRNAVLAIMAVLLFFTQYPSEAMAADVDMKSTFALLNDNVEEGFVVKISKSSITYDVYAPAYLQLTDGNFQLGENITADNGITYTVCGSDEMFSFYGKDKPAETQPGIITLENGCQVFSNIALQAMVHDEGMTYYALALAPNGKYYVADTFYDYSPVTYDAGNKTYKIGKKFSILYMTDSTPDTYKKISVSYMMKNKRKCTETHIYNLKHSKGTATELVDLDFG